MDSPSEMVREAAYKMYYWEEESQEALLTSILADRSELGRLCGFPTFAHRALSHSLAETPENIAGFMGLLGRELPARAARDHEALLHMKRRSNPLCQPLALWDVPYYSSLARANCFQLDTERIAEYFSLGVAMEGLNDLFRSLYGVSLSVEPVQDGELWSPDVFKLAVSEENGSLLGHIYCDFFSRAGKPHQDCHFTIRGGRERADGTYQNPVVVLMLNMAAPGWRSPTLLSPSALDNLFHEMGHAMHSMLGRTKYQHVTGTRCSTDFAEVPSTLMEYFAADPRVLARMNKHFRTGESLPFHVIEKICATKKIFAAAEMQTQLVYSAVDQVGCYFV
jgi:intermediate peptidase